MIADRYAVHFTPNESGVHYVHVRLDGIHVPGSPYPVQVGKLNADAGCVRAYGDGLFHGSTGMISQIHIHSKGSIVKNLQNKFVKKSWHTTSSK